MQRTFQLRLIIRITWKASLWIDEKEIKIAQDFYEISNIKDKLVKRYSQNFLGLFLQLEWYKLYHFMNCSSVIFKNGW